MENFEENKAKNNENENEYVSGADAEIKNSSADSQKNDDIVRKIIFALCYLWGILFFLPLILYKNDVYVVTDNKNPLPLIGGIKIIK